MTSSERHELRYQRRKAERLEKRRERNKLYDNYDEVFTFDHLYKSYKKCCKGVGWKASTQAFKANALLNITKLYNQLKEEKFKSRGFKEFDIMERGKPRHIKAVHITERIVQRCLCDYSLTPIFTAPLIYDNGACIKNKGISFTVNRVRTQFHRYYRKYGNKGYILVFDFSKYFDTIDHEILKSIIKKYYTDERLIKLLFQLIDNFGGTAGLGLGSQISQISALMYPDILDHYLKEKVHLKYYSRYMDDGNMLSIDKQFLQECLLKIKKICDSLGVKLNPKKTQIVKISRGLPFLKKHFVLTKSGAVIVRPSRKGVTKRRHTIKKHRRLLTTGEEKFERIYQSQQSSKGYFKDCDAFYTERRLVMLFNEAFADELYDYENYKE